MDVPFMFWLSIIEGVVLLGSFLVLLAQKTQSCQKSNGTLSSKANSQTDFSKESLSRRNHMHRIIFDTTISFAISVFLFYTNACSIEFSVKNRQKSFYPIISSAIMCVTWLYTLAIAFASLRFPLPSKLGYLLNGHLLVLYLSLLSTTIGFSIAILRNTPSIGLTRHLLVSVPATFAFDLVYNTGTVKNENGIKAINHLVNFICGFFFFSWMSPIIATIQSKGEGLTDSDLPKLAAKYSACNMLDVPEKTRKQRLWRRLYRENRISIVLQIFFSIAIPCLSYSSPFFLNRLLLLIQEKDHGQSITAGLQYLLAMACCNVLDSILIAQSEYNARVHIKMKTRNLLNIEIYRKILYNTDPSVLLCDKNNTDTSKFGDNNESADKEEAKEERQSASSASVGMIFNMINSDTDRISDFVDDCSLVLNAPVKLIAGTYFLCTQLGWSCIPGILVLVSVFPLSYLNGKLITDVSTKYFKLYNQRTSAINELLQGIRQIKFLSWESSWTKRILDIRDRETALLKQSFMSSALTSLIYEGLPILVTVASFWTFTKVQGQELNAAVAFTSITIFRELQSSLFNIPHIVTCLSDMLPSVKRVERYLNEGEIQRPVCASAINSNAVHIQGSLDTKSNVEIGFQNATVSWAIPKENYRLAKNQVSINAGKLTEPSDNVKNSTSFVLKNLNITFPKNKLSLICGATGSGKTLLMLSLLGETNTLKGSVFCPRTFSSSTLDTVSSITSIKVSQDHPSIVPDNWILEHAVAYVSQTAWLQNASIKDNILFGLPYVHKRYKATLTACDLDKDLSYLDDGDMTEIGEKGITLSGGQKARVALARAVYSRAQNVLMDDVMSAVDAHTAKHLYERCLQGPLMQDRTRILITHHVGLCIQKSVYIVFIKNGQVELSGSPEELKQSDQLSHLFKEDVKLKEDDNIVENYQTVHNNEQEDNEPKVLIKEELRNTGMIKLKVYRLYLKFYGNWALWFVFFADVFGCRLLHVLSSWWLKTWTKTYETSNDGPNLFFANHSNFTSFIAEPIQIHSSDRYNETSAVDSPFIFPVSTDGKQTNQSLNYYLGIYLGISLLIMLVDLVKNILLDWGSLLGGTNFYATLLDRVLCAPLRYFDTTPVSRIVYWFNKDFETVDSSIPYEFSNICNQWASFVTSIVATVVVVPKLFFPVMLASVVNIFFGLQFISASRELKRMCSVSSSSLLTHFSESITGVATIRAFGVTEHFMLNAIKQIDTKSRPQYYLSNCNLWADIRVSLISNVTTIITGGIILFSLDRLDASTAGFCLRYFVSFTGLVYGTVRRYTELEKNFNSVERLAEVLEIEQEAPTITDIRSPKYWPSEGALEIKNLHVKYSPDLDTVLKGVTFSVKPREKIGIVGRTGSGKSTLALSLYRFVEATEGSITIDGIDIADIGTRDLRSNLTIIPQDPILFSGTLRSNMDPFDQFTDKEILAAFRIVRLLEELPEETIADEVTNQHILEHLGKASLLTEVSTNQNVFKDLEEPVKESGSNFSQGQKQLLCLARALLHHSKVVIMDEATASVDFETDRAIRKVIATDFADSTVLCIAHRLNTVIEYDRILVLDKGEIMEASNPLQLIRNPNSLFHHLCRETGEFENLLELAKAKHELVNEF